MRALAKYTVLALLIPVLAGCENSETEVVAEIEKPLPPVALSSEVAVTGGTIRGIVGDDGLKQYHGVPYVAAPVGDLRWAPPAPVEPWEGPLDASKAGPACLQPVSQGGEFYSQGDIDMSEDCLTLNIWSRATNVDEKLPVMVWIHGGALVNGSGSTYPGQFLTSKGVVLVTINYRLGRFGFQAHPELSAENPNGVSGNQGLRDQIAALEWVQENITSFGGDPGKVTIFGESAGSLSVSLLQASPLAKGLFHGAIGQSGGAFLPMWFREKATSYAMSAEAVGEKFGAAAAGENGETSLAALRALPAEAVLAASAADPLFLNYDGLAIVDGEVIPKEVNAIFAAGEQSNVPVMIGSNADEATTFVGFLSQGFGKGTEGYHAWRNFSLPEVAAEMDAVYDPADPERAMIDAFSDQVFAYPMQAWARHMDNVSSDAYLYWFTWHPPIENSEYYGAFHAGELGYVFGNPDLFGAVPTDADHAFSNQMATIWTQFAKTGNPNTPGNPEWSPFTSESQAYMELGPEIVGRTDLRTVEMALIEKAARIRRDGEPAS